MKRIMLNIALVTASSCRMPAPPTLHAPPPTPHPWPFMVSLPTTMLNNFVRCAVWQQLLSLWNIFCSTGDAGGYGGGGQEEAIGYFRVTTGRGGVGRAKWLAPPWETPWCCYICSCCCDCLCLCLYFVSCGRRYIIQNLHKINKLNMPDMRCAVGRQDQPKLARPRPLGEK